ncbi:MAG: glucosamine-6-phosphate deaminase [Lentisphaeria bacterium]|nr:MAG: glucosamine-6-phosphate deaminase [Lentisphaeria bacterium]
MQIRIFKDKLSLGTAAAAAGAEKIRQALQQKGTANIILATGKSQFEMLSSLLKESGIDWNAISIFHLDEYIGLLASHPAGFRRYLWERFISKLPVPPAAFYPINGSAQDPEKECARLGELIANYPIDVAFIGIGENGHIAFNDPPADFNTEKAYQVISLDEKCRLQQLGEGWFQTFEDVPLHAISMGVRQILKSKTIINTVPDFRKAEAVRNALEGEISNLCPASILRTHSDVITFLDRDSASLLEGNYA